MSDNPARVSCSFHLGGPGTMTDDQQFSMYVSRTLDILGYNQDMIKYRVKTYQGFQKYRNVVLSPKELIYAGSKAEGLTSIYKSDTDIMRVFPGVICADNVRHFIHKRNTTVFQTNEQYIHAGYTKLKLVNSSGKYLVNFSLIKDENGDKYLSSHTFISGLFQINSHTFKYFNFHERSGPSIPVSDMEGYLHGDNVVSFRCVCPAFLQFFLARPRPHNRPSLNELHDISVMEAHVVPVGHKESNESHLEWRICFTKAEIYLVQRLNETETKLYIILKMVSKLLKVISKDITSYVMKNIVLWLVEIYPVDIFTEDLLTYQLIKALRFLQKCVEANYLPSYMIPERNLLNLRLNPVQKFKLTTFLSTLIQERGCLLMRCGKLRDGMTILYREPDMAEEFRKRRDMAEKLLLLRAKIKLEKMATTGLSGDVVETLFDTDGTTIKFVNIKVRVLLPDNMFLLWQGRSAEAIGNLLTERFIQMLSYCSDS